MSNGRRVVNYTRSIATFHGLDDTLLTGNKPGYTEVAGLLLASTATINGTEYAIVVMNAPMNAYQSTHVLDTYKVLDLVSTKNFEKRTILEKGTLLKKIKVVDGTINEYPVYLDKDIKKILSDEDYVNVRTEYNIVDKLDSNSKVGDNVGFVDVFVGEDLIATENVYLKDTIYESNEDNSYKTNLIIPSIALMSSFFIVAAISIRLFFKSKSQTKNKKIKKKKERKTKK
jgi:D-alanyl-D-alanine carboxypeptidase